MKKYLLGAALLLLAAPAKASLIFVSGGSGTSASGVSVYSATSTAAFPFGLTASTITASTITVTGQYCAPDGTCVATFAVASSSGVMNQNTLQNASFYVLIGQFQNGIYNAYMPAGSVLFTSGTLVTGSSTTVGGVDTSNTVGIPGNAQWFFPSTVQMTYGSLTPNSGSVIFISTTTGQTTGVIREITGSLGNNFLLNAFGHTNTEISYGVAGINTIYQPTTAGDFVLAARTQDAAVRIGAGSAGGIPNAFTVFVASAIFTAPNSLATNYTVLVTSGNSTTGIWGVTPTGHVISSGTIPTVAAASCGNGAHVIGNSSDNDGAVTWGGEVSSCTVNLGTAFADKGFCIATSTGVGTNVGISYPVTTALNFNFSALTGSTITWHCIGGPGL